MMKPVEKMAALIGYLEDGKLVQIATPLRVFEVELKHLKKFEKAGRPLFKADENSLYMSVGKRYDCIDYCKITIWNC